MHNTLKKWLAELEEETVIVCAEEVNQEARQNMVSFGFNHDSLEEWGKDSVIAFITECASLYHRKGSVSEMLFYSWFDEQAGQIRISAVDKRYGILPFGCQLNKVNLNELVDGIYADDSGLFTNGKLDIWQKTL